MNESQNCLRESCDKQTCALNFKWIDSVESNLLWYNADRPLAFNGLRAIISQKIQIFITTANSVRKSEETPLVGRFRLRWEDHTKMIFVKQWELWSVWNFLSIWATLLHGDSSTVLGISAKKTSKKTMTPLKTNNLHPLCYFQLQFCITKGRFTMICFKAPFNYNTRQSLPPHEERVDIFNYLSLMQHLTCTVMLLWTTSTPEPPRRLWERYGEREGKFQRCSQATAWILIIPCSSYTSRLNFTVTNTKTHRRSPKLWLQRKLNFRQMIL
jgi:hypothetical protein